MNNRTGNHRTGGRRGPLAKQDGRILTQMAIRIRPEVLGAIRADAEERDETYAIVIGELIEQAWATRQAKNE